MHIEVQGAGISMDANRLPGLTGLAGLLIDPLLPVGRPPTTRGHGAASEIVCCASEGRQHTSASSRAGAVDEGSGWSCTALGQHTIAGAHGARSATSRVPKDGINGGEITASGAVRLSMEPCAGAGHDRERLLHGTEANGPSVRPAAMHRSCGRHTRLDVKLTPLRRVMSSEMRSSFGAVAFTFKRNV